MKNTLHTLMIFHVALLLTRNSFHSKRGQECSHTYEIHWAYYVLRHPEASVLTKGGMAYSKRDYGTSYVTTPCGAEVLSYMLLGKPICGQNSCVQKARSDMRVAFLLFTLIHLKILAFKCISQCPKKYNGYNKFPFYQRLRLSACYCGSLCQPTREIIAGQVD